MDTQSRKYQLASEAEVLHNNLQRDLADLRKRMPYTQCAYMYLLGIVIKAERRATRRHLAYLATVQL
jgi:hypothetical protein